MPTEATQVAAWGPRSPLLATRACTSSCRGLLGRSREHQLPRTPARGPRASCRPFLSSPPHQKLEIMRPTRLSRSLVFAPHAKMQTICRAWPSPVPLAWGAVNRGTEPLVWRSRAGFARPEGYVTVGTTSGVAPAHRHAFVKGAQGQWPRAPLPPSPHLPGCSGYFCLV